VDYEAIRAEVEQLASQLNVGEEKARLFRVTFAAFLQKTKGLEVREVCPSCESKLVVTALSPSAWRIDCTSHACRDTLRGL